MEEFMTMIILFVLVMIVLKCIFAEVDGRRAIKYMNIKWFLKLQEPFKYIRGTMMVIFFVFLFVFQYPGLLASMEGLIQLAIYVAIGMVADVVSQYVYQLYCRYRFKKVIKDAEMIKIEIEAAKQKEDHDLIEESPLPYDFATIAKERVQFEDHVAFSTVDGGRFVRSFDPIPRISYVIDAFKERAEALFQGTTTKVTTLTQDGRLPFKDEKIDDYVCVDTNFLTSEVRRILKPQGYFVVCQKGSHHLKEYKPLFAPVIMTNMVWNLQACIQRLESGGFQVLDYAENYGKIRYKSLSAILTHLKELDPEKVIHSDLYLNQYAYMLQQIKQHDVFEVTTHRFYVVARKRNTNEFNMG